MHLYAHSLPGAPEHKWEPLLDHLRDVGQLARANAAAFGAEEFAYIAGLMHDLGKAKPAFQAYIRDGPDAPHAGEGARYAAARYPGAIGRVLAFCIAGHHAGLANGVLDGGGTTPLDERLRQAETIALPDGLSAPEAPRTPPGPLASACSKNEQAFALSFLIRMLFSCLCDADFVATERFYARARGEPVDRGWSGDLRALKARLDAHVDALSEGKTGEVNALRGQVLAACRASAQAPPGLFSLTVPTGGGKTLASLAFALEHALTHNLRRVIYVAPYTSIIEQTADVFRKALEDSDAILEHHSNFDWDRQRGDQDDEGRDGLQKLRRAAENWDRPIVVTTAVQFFESLFANRTSRCRKVHNIARSVIILDEAQSLPLRLLRPCLAATKELVRGYGASIVFCTATQPAVREQDGFGPAEKLHGVREIAPDPPRLYESLKRVRTEALQAIGDADLVARLVAEDRVLCIVNKRQHARRLFDALPDEGRFHLSTLMTPDHRRAKLAEVRQRLKAEGCVRLVSTSLVEAGVDVDFPAVYRALTGIDSIAQAAGRCNRENTLGREGGRVYVFEPAAPEDAPPCDVKQLADAARTVLRDHAGDPLSLEAVRAYFEEVYWRRGHEQLDHAKVGECQGAPRFNGVMEALTATAPGLNFVFADIAQAFRVIDEVMALLIVPTFAGMPHGASEAHLWEVRHAPFPSGACRRALQRASVQIPPRALQALIAAGAAEVVRPGGFGDQFTVLTNHDLYDLDAGLDWSDATFRSATSLIA